MAFLMSAVDVAAPGGVWEWFILNVFGFIANYGWRVVVFVILLKLVLSPLDFYQKYKMRKNQKITEALKPQMEKLEKQFGENKEALQRKQMELNRKAGFSYMSSCIPMIITLVLFITFYTALRSVSGYMEFKQYVEMYDAYVTTYEETGFDYVVRASGLDFALDDKVGDGEIDYAEMDNWLKAVVVDEETVNSVIGSEEIKSLFTGIIGDDPAKTILRYKTDYIDSGKGYKEFVADFKGKNFHTLGASDGDLCFAMSVLMQAKAQEATVPAFEANRTKFLWIKSLWVADVPWSDSVPTYESFAGTVGDYLSWDKNKGKVYTDNQTLFNRMADEPTYNIVTAKVRENPELYKTNGYLILAILIVALSVSSQLISMRQQKKAGQVMEGQGAGMMKMMMWLMPIMFVVFALTTSSAFTLYMVVNSAMSLIINLLTSLLVNLFDRDRRKPQTVIVQHGRKDPHDRINKN